MMLSVDVDESSLQMLLVTSVILSKITHVYSIPNDNKQLLYFIHIHLYSILQHTQLFNQQTMVNLT